MNFFQSHLICKILCWEKQMLLIFVEERQLNFNLQKLDVSQTYVDALKNTGEFTKEAQVIAKEKAIDIATKLITEDGKKAVEEIYGDFSIWLSTTIESNVKKNK